MIKKSVDEAVFDTILTHAFRDAAKEDMKDEALDKDFVPVKLTPEHLQIEQKAFKRYEARYKRQVNANRYTVLRRVVSCILIVGTLGFVTMLAVPPVRAAVIDAVVEFFDKYTSFDFGAYIYGEAYKLGDYELRYIPDGFELTKQEETRLYSEYTLTNAETSIDIRINIAPADSTTIKYDSEHSEYNVVAVNNYTAYLVKSEIDETLQLMYNDGTNVITITGALSQKEILKIAENIS